MWQKPEDMRNNIDRPTVSETLVALSVGNTVGIAVGQGLQAFALNGREFAYQIIAVRQVNFVQPRSRALPAAPCLQRDGLPAHGVYSVRLPRDAYVTYPYRLGNHGALMALKSIFQRCACVICGQTVGFSRPWNGVVNNVCEHYSLVGGLHNAGNIRPVAPFSRLSGNKRGVYHYRLHAQLTAYSFLYPLMYRKIIFVQKPPRSAFAKRPNIFGKKPPALAANLGLSSPFCDRPVCTWRAAHQQVVPLELREITLENVAEAPYRGIIFLAYFYGILVNFKGGIILNGNIRAFKSGASAGNTVK